MNLMETAAAVCIVGTIVAGTLLALSPPSPSRMVEQIGKDIGNRPFDLSCSADGALDHLGRRNCLQYAGYRVGRPGMATFVAKIDAVGVPRVIFRVGAGEDMIGSLRDFHAAFTKSEKPPTEP